ncbi:hypothetical protein BB737_14955 [Mycobacterium avium subsp. hominissuis]|uniref:ESX-1 secretion-associated protein EspG1 n=2 Tax=Mycobacterium TaxID=1763 RepID=A0AA37UZH6_9MYCO|nr:ESX secretion-associated protein EspG [Mycobacterium avium]APA78408.2 ESX secretion-associated protein EspG [Mycobacterium avium subsp. hominissuis]PBJ39143.1 hypothetical protein XV03_03980 [Mycobacterium avium subsp. hominissuis]PBJ65046.1 hypothetical protein BB737_14955 [Mycobacterium avium subsp. hominissuis]GLB86101.1 hypothetical protein SRL2020028_53570 [Mycobacterium kiyosense]
MVAAVVQMSVSVSALLAFQRVAEVTMLPAQLHIRPQLLTMADRRLSITDDERRVLTEANMLAGDVPNEDAVTLLHALVSPDAEINLTLGAPGRHDTYVSLARRNELLVSAIRCNDDVTIDAYMSFQERDVISLLAATIRNYLFGPDEDGTPANIAQTRFSADDVVAAMCGEGAFEGSLTFYSAVKPHGVPESVADVLYLCEKTPLGRVYLAAFLCHEGTRSEPEVTVMVTNTSAGAVTTVVSLDNNGTRWVTAEPYDASELERRIATAIRSVPAASWFTHCRTD